jgi:hypothetical protein
MSGSGTGLELAEGPLGRRAADELPKVPTISLGDPELSLADPRQMAGVQNNPGSRVGSSGFLSVLQYCCSPRVAEASPEDWRFTDPLPRVSMEASEYAIITPHQVP